MSVNEKIDVSPDDSNIVYSFCDSSGCSSIQEFSIASGKTKIITLPDKFNYISPRYSPDGRKILFLTNITDKGNLNRISIYSKKTSAIAHISTGLQYVTEASFSMDGAGIYFIAVTHHKFASLKSAPTFSYDVYFIDTLGKNLQHVTEFAARSISGIAFVNSGNALLTNVETFDKKYGFYQVPLAIGEQPVLFNAHFIEGTKVGYNFTFSPSASPDGAEIIVASARVLLSIDIQSRQAKTLYSAGETFVYSPRHFHSSKKVAFTKDSLQAVEGQHPVAVARKIFIMDVPTRQIVECPLPSQ